jgi:hypothetical protein
MKRRDVLLMLGGWAAAAIVVVVTRETPRHRVTLPREGSVEELDRSVLARTEVVAAPIRPTLAPVHREGAQLRRSEVALALVPGPALAVDDSPRCKPRRHSANDMASLDRCIEGDAEGCVDIGAMYEDDECDSFSSIKWYRRACRGGSSRACEALGRVDDRR